MDKLNKLFWAQLFLTLTVFCAFPHSSHAQTYEQAMALYRARDYQTAFEAFKVLALQGNARAQLSLGWMLEAGEGVPKDEVEAAKWYRKAADKGLAHAQYNLGVMHSEGRGVAKDDKQAVNWYRKAADRGETLAQIAMGQAYENGIGVQDNDQTAYFWYLIAATQGNKNAIAKRNELAARLTVQQRISPEMSFP